MSLGWPRSRVSTTWKLTAGYDISGNDDIDYYASRSYFSQHQFLRAVNGITFGGIGNNEIQWETTRRFNAGLESSFINNRLYLSLNYFRSTTDNLLTRQSIGFLSGIAENWSNGGKLQNEGFNVAFNAKVLALKDWQWQLGASVGHYKNKIVELADNNAIVDNEVYGAVIRTQVGQPANMFYGYKALGVFGTTGEAQQAGTSDPKGLYFIGDNGIDHNYFEAGDVHFADLNGDGMITDADRTIIGDPNPDIYGNIFTTLAWKRLEARRTLQLFTGQRRLQLHALAARGWQPLHEPDHGHAAPLAGRRSADRHASHHLPGPHGQLALPAPAGLRMVLTCA